MLAEIEVREVYGVKRYYPANPTARIFAELTGKQTLTLDAIELMRKLGVGIKAVQKEIEWEACTADYAKQGTYRF